MSNKDQSRLLKTLRREPVDRKPVWMMRQAGRYLPEYRAVRQQVGSFTELCKTPELASEVTLQPLRRFDLDAAIIFSDILTIPEAMGQSLSLIPGEGPKLAPALRTEDQINNLPVVDIDQLDYVMRAITMTDQALSDTAIPLIGFTGSPWTLACYMVDGQSNKHFKETKTLMYRRPDLMNQLLDKLTTMVSGYLKAQIQAGSDALMIFDSWGGLLATEDYRQFSLKPIQRIIESVKAYSDTPITLFTKGGGQWLADQKAIGPDCLSLDWMTDLGTARQALGDDITLQGNLDPLALFGTPEQVQQRVAEICAKHEGRSGHIFNLGHGILPDTPIESVLALVDAVHGGTNQ